MTGIDLNRAGTPLLEIVSEPDMHTAAEAKAYAYELYLRMKYAGVSEANLYYGNMRFDVNVSVNLISAGPDSLGTRTETKNINSFRSVEKTVDYEIQRQIEVLESGGTIIQETRGYDDTRQRTFSQRLKEDAHDYRYFPDPDLPPVTLTDEYIEQVRAEMPILPDEWRARLSKLGLDKAQVETLIDAEVEYPNEKYLNLLEQVMDDNSYAKQLANWLVNIDIPFVRTGLSVVTVSRSAVYRAVAALSHGGQLSSTNAKSLIADLLAAVSLPDDIAAYADTKGYNQNSDESAILSIVDKVMADNPKAAADVSSGETKAIGFLVGQVMKASQGKANPAVAQRLIKQQLGL